jgi:hypothetical protein
MIRIIYFAILFLHFGHSILSAHSEERVQALVNQLTSIHGPNWTQVRQLYPDQNSKLLEQLKAIVERPADYANLDYPGVEQAIRSSALKGLSILTPKNSDGSIPDSHIEYLEKTLEQEFQASDQKQIRMAVYHALKHTGSLGALELINKGLAKETDPHLVQTAVEMGANLLYGPKPLDIQGDLIYHDDQSPKLNEVFFLREQGNWEGPIKQLKQLAQSKYKNFPSDWKNYKIVQNNFKGFRQTFARAIKDFRYFEKNGKTPDYLKKLKTVPKRTISSVTDHEHGHHHHPIHSGPSKKKETKIQLLPDEDLLATEQDHSSDQNRELASERDESNSIFWDFKLIFILLALGMAMLVRSLWKRGKK